MRPGLVPGMSHTESEGLETPAAVRALGPLRGLLLADLAGTMERTARRWLTGYCEEGEQTVGVEVVVEREPALPEATRITATATLAAIEGRRFLFTVTAVNEDGVLIARGRHERRLIRQDRFAQRAPRPE
jgi:predicted thioesterase